MRPITRIISIDEARELLVSHVRPITRTERVPLAQCRGTNRKRRRHGAGVCSALLPVGDGRLRRHRSGYRRRLAPDTSHAADHRARLHGQHAHSRHQPRRVLGNRHWCAAARRQRRRRDVRGNATGRRRPCGNSGGCEPRAEHRPARCGHHARRSRREERRPAESEPAGSGRSGRRGRRRSVRPTSRGDSFHRQRNRRARPLSLGRTDLRRQSLHARGGRHQPWLHRGIARTGPRHDRGARRRAR